MIRRALLTAVPLFAAILFLCFVGIWSDRYSPVEYHGDEKIKLTACANLLTTYYSRCGNGHGGSYSCYCFDPVKLSSFSGCFERMGLNSKKTVDIVHKACNDPNLSVRDIRLALSNFHENSVYVNVTGRLDVGHMTHKQMMQHRPMGDESVIVDFGHYFPDLFLRINTALYGNKDKSLMYAIGGIVFWLGVCFISAVANWTTFFFPKSRMLFDGVYSRTWRKYVTLPALMDKKRNQEQKFYRLFDGLVPTRFESICVFIFFVYTLITQSVHIYHVKDDPYWSNARAISYYVGDRTGIPSLVWTILLIIFGGRSNILQWFTGWKFSTFVMYHRWIARIVVLLAIAHSIAYTYEEFLRGTYLIDIKTDFLIYGCFATIAGSFMCFQGILWLRRKSYEIFLVIHIILAVFWIMGCWVHVIWFGYTHFMIAAACLWVADRVIRFVRMGYFGCPKATVQLIEGDTLRVTVPKSPTLKVQPGGHCWLYFGYGWLLWQNHPFCYIESPNRESMVFLCKVKKGLTRRISNYLMAMPDKTCQMRVAIEGCYGESSNVSRHSDVIYLAGGHGFPGIYSEAVHSSAKSPEKQRIKLHWIIRDTTFLSMVWKELSALKGTKIEVSVYVTKPELCNEEDLSFLSTNKSAGPSIYEDRDEEKAAISAHESTHSVSSSTEKGSLETIDVLGRVKQFFPHIAFIEGRPSIEALIEQSIEEATQSCAFVTCGHPAMVDDVRAGVVQNIDSTPKRIDFFEQLQLHSFNGTLNDAEKV
ncbi:hypothetical protein ACNR91_001755 [Candidozyma auris]